MAGEEKLPFVASTFALEYHKFGSIDSACMHAVPTKKGQTYSLDHFSKCKTNFGPAIFNSNYCKIIPLADHWKTVKHGSD